MLPSMCAWSPADFAAIRGAWPLSLSCHQQLPALNVAVENYAACGAGHFPAAVFLDRVAVSQKQSAVLTMPGNWSSPPSLLSPLHFPSASQGYGPLSPPHREQSEPAVAAPGSQQPSNYAAALPNDRCCGHQPGNSDAQGIDAVGPMKKKIKFIQPVSTAWEQEATLSGVPATSKAAARSGGTVNEAARNTGSCDSAGGGSSGRKPLDSSQGQSSEAVPAKLSSKLKRKRMDCLERVPVSQGYDSSKSGQLVDGAQSVPVRGTDESIPSHLRTQSAPLACRLPETAHTGVFTPAAQYRSLSAGPVLIHQGKHKGDKICTVQKKLGVMYQDYVSARDVYLSQALYLINTLNKDGKGKSVVQTKLSDVAAVQRALEKAVQIIQQNSAISAEAHAPAALTVY